MSQGRPPYARGNYRDKWRLERQAQATRARLKLTQYDVIDPWRLADLVPAHVFYVDDIVDADLALRAGHAGWDGFAFQFPGESTLMVVLNPNRTTARQSATLMEELCHGLLRHAPTRLLQDPDTGLLRREYNQAQEHEAYDLGATILLPKELIQRAVANHVTASEVAAQHGCSIDLVHYRIQRCRLWKRYCKYLPR